MSGRFLLAACLLVLAALPCRADEEFDAAVAAAKQVVEFVKGKKADDLKKFAAEPGADPWLVVDALLEAGASDAAKAFAAAHEGKDAEALRAVAARGLKEPSDARRRLAEAEAKLAEPIAEDADPQTVGEAIVPLLKGGESIPDGVLRVRWLMARASALERAGRLKEQASDLERAAQIANRAGWKSAAVTLRRAAGGASFRDHDWRGALESWTRLSELQHEIGDHAGEAGSLADIAEIHKRFGETRFALGRIDQALDALPSDASSTQRAKLRARRGAMLARVGELRLARVELTAAIDILAALGESLDLADACIDLGNLHRDVGDWVGAKSGYARALEAYRAAGATASGTQSDSAAGVATARASLATILASEGRLQDAYDEFKAQREVFQASEDRGLAARALQAMADVRLRQSAESVDRERRVRWLEEARTNAMNASAESTDAREPESVLRARGSLGEAEEGLKHLDAAIRLYEDVVEGAQELGAFDIVLEYSVALARTRLRRENPNGTIEAVERGFRCLSDLFGDLGDQSRIKARAQHAELFGLGMRAALQRDPKEGIPLFFRFLEAGRAASLLDSLENRDLLRSRRIPPELEKARVDAARIVTERRLAIDGAGDARERRRAIAEAQAAYERAVGAIQEAARAGAHPDYPQPITLADAQAQLAPTEAIVLFAFVDVDAYALLVTRELAVPFRLGAAQESHDLCRATLVRHADPESAELWRRAGDAIWGPVEKQLPARVKTVYVCPDGNLGLMPFPALRPTDASRSFLFVPSASAFRLLRDRKGPRGVGTLAVGIEKYDKLPAMRSGVFRDRGSLGNLKAAEGEAREVGSEAGDVVLVGTEATEEALQRAIATRPIWSAIHFAVHGLLNQANPSLASLALAPSGENDGDLTVFEIFERDFPANVVVLAACDSANGGYVQGEGLVGLVRAFIFAGCPKVVANLWNADDAAAKTFALAFHKEWRKGTPLIDAIELARVQVRKNPKWSHPFYWAGWCAWGAAVPPGPR